MQQNWLLQVLNNDIIGKLIRIFLENDIYNMSYRSYISYSERLIQFN